MSVENLHKELEAVHDKIRTATTLEESIALMTERDNIMRDLVNARHEEAAYQQKLINELEESSRPKTVQMPYFNK